MKAGHTPDNGIKMLQQCGCMGEIHGTLKTPQTGVYSQRHGVYMHRAAK